MVNRRSTTLKNSPSGSPLNSKHSKHTNSAPKYQQPMITLHPIRHTSDEHWFTFTAIYHESFPIDEQRPTEDIARLIAEEERYRAMALVDDEGHCIGLLTTWKFDTYIYIEHFAIAPSKRSMGHGAKSLQHFMQSQHKPIVLEAEPPTDDITQRRINFYKRCGLMLYDYEYIQPPYTPERTAVPLRLMGNITDPNLTEIAGTLHCEVYGIKGQVITK